MNSKKEFTLILIIVINLYRKSIRYNQGYLIFKKKLWTFKNECNTKTCNCERTNKGVTKFVNSCVEFAFAEISHCIILSTRNGIQHKANGK